MPVSTVNRYTVHLPFGEVGFITAGLERLPVIVWVDDLEHFLKGFSVAQHTNQDGLDFHFVEFESSHPSEWFESSSIDFAANEVIEPNECELLGYCPANLADFDF